MRYYKKIFFWENCKRFNDLIMFRNLAVDYFNNIENGILYHELIENEKARETRVNLNLVLPKIQSIILASRLPTFVEFIPTQPGLQNVNIDLIQNIFNLYSYDVEPKFLIDLIERSIGIYQNDEMNSVFRTINPLFWFSLLVEYIVNLPFQFFGRRTIILLIKRLLQIPR